jgi:cation-transporting ATPase 13A1
MPCPKKSNSQLTLLVPFYLHTYVWPFAIIWPVFLRYFLAPDLYDKYIGGPEWTFVWCGTIITAQSLVWLSTNWNVNLKSLFTSVKAKTVADATLIKVLPVTNAGSSEICKIDRDNV